MVTRSSYQTLRDAVISHLTYAEGLGPLLSDAPARVAGSDLNRPETRPQGITLDAIKPLDILNLAS